MERILYTISTSKLYHFSEKWYQSCIADGGTNFVFEDLLYRSYIRKGKCYISSISDLAKGISKLYHSGKWKRQTAERYRTVISQSYIWISLLRKALSQCYTLPAIGISRYSARLIFLLIVVFAVEEYRKSVPFCPKRSSLLSPRRLRAKYTHRTNQRFVLCVFRPCRGQIHASVNYKYWRICSSARNGTGFVTGHLSVHSQGEVCCVQRNSFIQMSKLSNVRGRITYISSHAKQENLYVVYETTERSFWKELALCNQYEFRKSGTEGKPWEGVNKKAKTIENKGFSQKGKADGKNFIRW